MVDDHPVLRSGLEQLLSGADDIEVVGTAADGAEALEQVQATAPDVVLMDLQMPGVDGVTATRTILAETTGAEVLVLTSFSDGERIVAALDAGARRLPAQGRRPRRRPRRDPGGAAAASPRSTRGPRGSCWGPAAAARRDRRCS